MTHKSKEIIWTTLALAGIGLGALAASSAQGEEDAPLKGPEVKQADQPHRHKMDGEMREQRPGRDGRIGGNIRELLADLNLTDEQKEQVRTIMQETAEKAKAFHEAHKAEFEQLQADRKAAKEAGDREKLRELEKKHAELMKNAPRHEAIEKIKAILTPEQLATLEAKMKEQMAKAREGRGGQGPAAGEGDGTLRQKLRDMSPEEREKFMQEHRKQRQSDDAPKTDKPAGEKLDL